jgi:hypothetical protein
MLTVNDLINAALLLPLWVPENDTERVLDAELFTDDCNINVDSVWVPDCKRLSASVWLDF